MYPAFSLYQILSSQKESSGVRVEATSEADAKCCPQLGALSRREFLTEISSKGSPLIHSCFYKTHTRDSQSLFPPLNCDLTAVVKKKNRLSLPGHLGLPQTDSYVSRLCQAAFRGGSSSGPNNKQLEGFQQRLSPL